LSLLRRSSPRFLAGDFFDLSSDRLRSPLADDDEEEEDLERVLLAFFFFSLSFAAESPASPASTGGSDAVCGSEFAGAAVSGAAAGRSASAA
jgi:hypothetical protein